MVQKRKLISIVMPVLNEEEGLAKTIREIPVDELKRMGYDCEIIAVSYTHLTLPTKRIV